MTERRPDWDIDKARGEEAEALIRKYRTSMLTSSAEVKCDDQAAKTGNVYVEYQCKTTVGWKPSGIATTKAAMWFWVLYDMRVIVGMPVWLLRNITRETWADETRRKPCMSGSHPTRGVLLRVDELLSKARLAVPLDGDDEMKEAA